MTPLRSSLALLTLGMLGTSSVSSAANLSPTLWKYVTGQGVAKPSMESRMQNDLVMRIWNTPAGLNAEGAFVIYLPKLSTNHWMIAVLNPRSAAAEYLGSSKMTFFKTLTSQSDPTNKLSLYRINGGMFDGLLASQTDRKDNKGQTQRILLLATPQMMNDEIDPRQLLNR